MIDEINQPKILAGVIEKEQWFKKALHALNEKYQMFSEIRGRGLLLGAVMNEAWKDQAKKVQIAAAEQGLLLLVAGTNVVRMTPSLVITREEFDAGMQRFFDLALASLN